MYATLSADGANKIFSLFLCVIILYLNGRFILVCKYFSCKAYVIVCEFKSNSGKICLLTYRQPFVHSSNAGCIRKYQAFSLICKCTCTSVLHLLMTFNYISSWPWRCLVVAIPSLHQIWKPILSLWQPHDKLNTISAMIFSSRLMNIMHVTLGRYLKPCHVIVTWLGRVSEREEGELMSKLGFIEWTCIAWL